MQIRRMRYLTLFLMAMFFANNAAAAFRACAIDLAGQDQVAAHALEPRAGDTPCPESDESGPCLKHFVQSQQYDEQKTWAGVPAPVPLLAPKVLQLLITAQPRPVLIMAVAPPVVGPPLTILYGNFRN